MSLNLTSRAVLRRLAVFAGPFGLAAATSVAAFKGLHSSVVVDHVAKPGGEVADCHHLRRTRCALPSARHDPGICVGQLTAADEADQAAGRHVAWLLETLPSIEAEIGTRHPVRARVQQLRAADRRCSHGARLGFFTQRKQPYWHDIGGQLRLALAALVVGERMSKVGSNAYWAPATISTRPRACA